MGKIFHIIAILFLSIPLLSQTYTINKSLRLLKEDKSSLQIQQVIFSKTGGIYDNSFLLTIESNISNSLIYYTTDGTTPTINSNQYSAPLSIDNSLCSQANISQIQISPPNLYHPPNENDVIKAIVIRAAVFDNYGNRVSDVITNSYFIKQLGINHNNLPVISICAEGFDLFDFETGIFVPGVHWDEDNPDWTGNYYQHGDEWEKEVNFEFYEQIGESGINQLSGLRTHGGNSRRFPQKGMRLYARSEYGNSTFNYPIFKDKSIIKYKRLVLKPIASSWSQAGIEDYITNNMAAATKINSISTRFVVVYLNGEYWGIYNLQERIDKRYIEENYNVDKDNIDLIENWAGECMAGTKNNFIELYDFIEQNDFSLSVNYDSITNWIDIENFIDYQLFEIFIANYDWPSNNMKCWREQKEGAKWKWIFFDGDAAISSLNFDAYQHALNTGDDSWPTNKYVTLFLRKLIVNENFKLAFFNRFEELLNNQFNYKNTNEIFQNSILVIGDEIPTQIIRFAYPVNFNLWAEKVLNCKSFLTYRTCEIKSQTADLFNIDLLVNNCFDEGVSIRDLLIAPNPNNGIFNIRLYSSETFIATIQISNLLGQSTEIIKQVLTKGFNNIEIDKNNLSNGLYLVNIITNNEIFGTKMIVINNY